MLKKWTAVLCMAILLLALAVSAGAAEEVVYQTEGIVKTGTVDGGISNEAALEGFINRAFGIGTGARRGSRKAPQVLQGNKLDGISRQIYDSLSEYIKQVALGNLNDTEFRVLAGSPTETGGLSYTTEGLGVESFLDGNYISDEALSAYYAKSGVNLPVIINCLMVDLPYDLFWFDKTVGYSCSILLRGDKMTIFDNEGYVVISMYVAKEYSELKVQGTTDYDTTKSESILTAAANAQQIVDDNSGESDLSKLNAYKDAICASVTYYTAAAAGGMAYGDPWQLIWVFDNDPSTNVVCEGYSKAFKYLCDLSDFNSNISVSIVSGMMSGGTGAGPHMWNLVKLADGKRYLVDVTNCDNGSVGYPDRLFMAGYSSIGDGTDYTYIYLDGEISYTYDSEMLDLYSVEELAVEANDKLAAPEFSNFSYYGLPGTGISATVSIPEGASMVVVKLIRINVNNEAIDTGYQEILSVNDSAQVNILGIYTQFAGTYQLTAKALCHEQVGEYNIMDSETISSGYLLFEGDEPSTLDDIQIPETVMFGEAIPFTVPGAEAVAFLAGPADHSWSYGMPKQGTPGTSSTIAYEEPGAMISTIWAQFNGVWSKPLEKTVYVRPLGTLSAPDIIWGYRSINGNISLTAEDQLIFTIEVNEQASYDNYTYILYKDTGDQQEEVCHDNFKGNSITIDLTECLQEQGLYQLVCNGHCPGWLADTKTINIYFANGDYTVVDGSIVKYHGAESVTELIIPSTIDNQMITTIGSSAFEQQQQLTAVTLPDTLTYIGDFSFYGCSGLRQITIPANVTGLGDGAFCNSGLTEVNFASTESKTVEYFYEPNGSGNARVYHLALPDNIREAIVKSSAFLGTNLPSDVPDFVTPNHLTTIDESAFANTAAHFVWLTNSVASIGSNSFAGCSNLRVRIPTGMKVSDIGENAFPAGTIIFVVWESDKNWNDYANRNHLKLVYYAESFN